VATFYEMAQLSKAVYASPPAPLPAGWTVVSTLAAGAGYFHGLQAAAFTKAGETVIAFRGTQTMVDVAADLQLGTGFNTAHFGAADSFASGFANTPNLSLTGHSLGGAIAQVVGNRASKPFATYNAPGVGVIASRNLLRGTPWMDAIRVGGMLTSAVAAPRQAYRDVRAAFHWCRGVNICLGADAVSQMGLHYGKVVRISGTGYNPVSQHYMDTVLEVLDRSPLRNLTIGDYFAT
jgi:hypothetical protein